MNAGDVVLTPLPQADGKLKNRPAILLCAMPPFSDWLLCGISTQLHLEVTNFDEVVRPGDADFGTSGLKAASLIRLGYLAVLAGNTFIGRIGNIAPDRHRRLLDRLSEYLRRMP